MASWATSEAVRKTMLSNRSRDTRPEMTIRREVHRLGVRYAIDARPLPRLNRRADLVFRSAKVAVFVNGCFWHSCSLHGTQPKSNSHYWSEKLTRNHERDVETALLLKQAGWASITVWEHDDPTEAAVRIVTLVLDRRAICKSRK